MAFFGPEMPIPALEEDTREFWENCRQHRLTVQRCALCGSFRFAPTPACYECQSFDYEWVESQGIGEVYSWSVTHQAMHPGAIPAVPYNSTVVRLLDCGGAKVLSNLVGVNNEDIRAGMKVKVEWDQISADLSLPRFRPI